MFSRIALVGFTALTCIANATNVDVTREVCSGPLCKAYLMTLPLDGNATINQPATGLCLTGVNNPGGNIVDINRIECDFAIKGQTGTSAPIFTRKDSVYLGASSAEIEWILCSYNRASPGKI